MNKDSETDHDPNQVTQTFRPQKRRVYTEEELNRSIPSQMVLPGQPGHVTSTLLSPRPDDSPKADGTSPSEATIIPSTLTPAKPRHFSPPGGLSVLELGRLKREAFAVDLRKAKKEDILSKKRALGPPSVPVDKTSRDYLDTFAFVNAHNPQELRTALLKGITPASWA